MTSQNSPPGADPPGPPAGTGPGGEETRIRSLDERFAKIEQDRAEDHGILEKILDRLPGGDSGGKSADPPAGKGEPAGGDIQSQVRAEIAAARQRDEEEARKKGDADWRKHVDETLERLMPEKPPREPQAGFKGRLQRALYGKPD